jgi:hypothetical protein
VKKILSLLILFVFSGCSGKKETLTTHTDFESLMGKRLPAWQYVITREDFENLKHFQTLFEKNLPLLSTSSAQEKIPHTLHFIWLGPKEFPRDSIANVRSWIGKHPDWKVYFWTDRERPLPHPAMQKKWVSEFPFEKLAEYFDRTDNFAEKSDLLRYEILNQLGGVYVDHDVKCLKPFGTLNNSYDLYCGLEVPFKTPLSSSVFPTNNLIGARPGHPIITSCIEEIINRWDQIEQDYPGKERDAVISRVAHRTFAAFGEMVKAKANQGTVDIVFPAFYFNAPKEAWALMARHEYKGTWFENESPFEKTTRERLMYLSKKVNKILLACSLMTALNLMGFAALVLFTRKRANG